MADATRFLFSAIEKDPNEVYYFVTKKYTREEAENWIDDLPELIACCFPPSVVDEVTLDSQPTRSYRALPMENTDNAVLLYNTSLSGDMGATSPEGNDPNAIAVVKEDVLENCWTAPPRLIYSQTDSDSTVLST
eukprot:6673591-Ditylum_brightwellii.AAC.1